MHIELQSKGGGRRVVGLLAKMRIPLVSPVAFLGLVWLLDGAT
ncbi:hypothetical protein [Micromonospora zamorensis]|nr:hypothetical protein OG886_28810 [Micromonospora zamorensis]